MWKCLKNKILISRHILTSRVKNMGRTSKIETPRREILSIVWLGTICGEDRAKIFAHTTAHFETSLSYTIKLHKSMTSWLHPIQRSLLFWILFVHIELGASSVISAVYIIYSYKVYNIMYADASLNSWPLRSIHVLPIMFFFSRVTYHNTGALLYSSMSNSQKVSYLI